MDLNQRQIEEKIKNLEYAILAGNLEAEEEYYHEKSLQYLSEFGAKEKANELRKRLREASIQYQTAHIRKGIKEGYQCPERLEKLRSWDQNDLATQLESEWQEAEAQNPRYYTRLVDYYPGAFVKTDEIVEELRDVTGFDLYPFMAWGKWQEEKKNSLLPQGPLFKVVSSEVLEDPLTYFDPDEHFPYRDDFDDFDEGYEIKLVKVPEDSKEAIEYRTYQKNFQKYIKTMESWGSAMKKVKASLQGKTQINRSANVKELKEGAEFIDEFARAYAILVKNSEVYFLMPPKYKAKNPKGKEWIIGYHTPITPPLAEQIDIMKREREILTSLKESLKKIDPFLEREEKKLEWDYLELMDGEPPVTLEAVMFQHVHDLCE